MQPAPLGKTGILVSPLGLGTVKLGRDRGVKYPEPFTIPDDRAAADLLALSSELGINLIDTAPAYGNSETRLGSLLKGQRQRWVICTKVGEEFDNGESRFDFSAAHARNSIERSLRRLNTDYLDIVLIHSNGNDRQILEQSDCLQELRRCQQEGLIGAVGISIKTIEGGLLAADCCDVVMASYNPAYQDELPVLDACADRKTGVLIKKALASGHLTHQGEDPVQQAMSLVFSHPATSSAIIGTINPEHLRANVAAANKALEKNLKPLP